MTKILYFTAGAIATVGELAEIAQFNAAAVAPYTVEVRRGDGNGSLMYGAGTEAADMVAGTPPAPYNVALDYPVADPDNPPTAGNLPSTQAVVSNGQVIAVAGGNATITVVGGVVTNIVVAA